MSGLGAVAEAMVVGTRVGHLTKLGGLGDVVVIQSVPADDERPVSE